MYSATENKHNITGQWSVEVHRKFTQ